MAGMISQIPGGALADAVTWKRGLAAAGIIMTGVAALILAFALDMVSVFIAQVLQGATAGIITPAIGAISLGSVGTKLNVGAHRTEFSLFRLRPRSDRRANGRCRCLYCQGRGTSKSLLR